jgi:hypothetical protein
MTVSNASFFGDGVIVDGFESSGALVINNGTVTLGSGLEIGVTSRQYGSVSLNGGMLVVTNSSIDIGGYPGDGDLTVSDGTFLGGTVFLAEDGVLSIQGGTSILSSSLSLDIGGEVDISGGELVVTNGSISMHGDFAGLPQCAISGGLLAANDIELGVNFSTGALSVNGGLATVSTGITLGGCADDGVGYVTVSDGQLIVTNAAHTGFIDVQNGQLVLSSGILQVDKLVMTNSCSQFIHTGGTLIVGSVVLDPNAFQIVSVTPQGKDILISWLMGPGQTNALQATAGGAHGSYTTNGFADIFVVTNNTTTGSLTNYLDIGAATNVPSRFYRARLAP